MQVVEEHKHETERERKAQDNSRAQAEREQTNQRPSVRCRQKTSTNEGSHEAHRQTKR